MKNYKGIKYNVKQNMNSFKLSIPKFKINIKVDGVFKESDLLDYIWGGNIIEKINKANSILQSNQEIRSYMKDMFCLFYTDFTANPVKTYDLKSMVELADYVIRLNEI